MANMVGLKGEKFLSGIGFEKQIVSMGHQASGALELWNYPVWMRDLIVQNVDGKDRVDHVDMIALEGEIIISPLLPHRLTVYVQFGVELTIELVYNCSLQGQGEKSCEVQSIPQSLIIASHLQMGRSNR